MFVASGGVTTALMWRVLLRTIHGWEQGVFNEELNWGVGKNVSCCHAPGGRSFDPIMQHFTKDEETHSMKLAMKRRPPELMAGCGGALRQINAPFPPKASPLRWQRGAQGSTGCSGSTKRWTQCEFNALALRALGRCTELRNLCESSSLPPSTPGTPPPPFPPPLAFPKLPLKINNFFNFPQLVTPCSRVSFRCLRGLDSRQAVELDRAFAGI
jgi:hypothetical protein